MVLEAVLLEFQGAGVFRHDAGLVIGESVFPGRGDLNGDPGGVGTLVIGPGGSVNCSDSAVMIYPGSTLNVSGGTIASSSLQIQDGGVFNYNHGSVYLTNFSDPELTIDSPTFMPGKICLNASDSITVSGPLAIAAGTTLTMKGGTFFAETLDGPGQIKFLSGNLTFDSTPISIDTGAILGANVTVPNGSSITANAQLSVGSNSVGSLTIQAGGTVFSQGDVSIGSNPGSMGTVHNEGTITTLYGCVYVGAYSDPYTGAVTRGGTGILTGSGTIGAPLYNFGIVAPGDLKVLEVQEYHQDTTGTLDIEIGSSPDDGQYDSLFVDDSDFADSSLSLAGSLDVSFSNGFASTTGDIYTIISVPDGTDPDYLNQFDNLPDGSLFDVGNREFEINYDPDIGVTLTDVGAKVPEPSSLAFGGLLLLAKRRNRKHFQIRPIKF